MNNTRIATKTRANLRFAGQIHILNVTDYDNQSLTEDILTLPSRGTNQTSFTRIAAGYILLSISKYECEVLSKDTLTIKGADYKVMLTSPMRLENCEER